jgi:hypothetical protein
MKSEKLNFEYGNHVKLEKDQHFAKKRKKKCFLKEKEMKDGLMTFHRKTHLRKYVLIYTSEFNKTQKSINAMSDFI